MHRRFKTSRAEIFWSVLVPRSTLFSNTRIDSSSEPHQGHMFDLAPRQMTKNDDFGGVGSLASRWILAAKFLERPPLRTSIAIHKYTSLVVKAPLFYRQALPEWHTIRFSDFTKVLQSRLKHTAFLPYASCACFPRRLFNTEASAKQ